LEFLQGLLYTISTAFLPPVLAAVLAVFLYTTYRVGRFLSEAQDHRRNRREMEAFLAERRGPGEFLAAGWRGELRAFRQALEQHRDSPALFEKKVVDLENRMRRRVERLGILARTGPILGLVGTLIPLQPALAGLARGDMQTMGANLLIGFTTTVLGLITGGACYAMSVALRNWYQQDITDIHFLVSQWMPVLELEAETGSHDALESLGPRTTPTARLDR